MALVGSTYVPGANMGDASMGDANMGNIFGDAWSYIKKDPLILAPPLWLGEQQIKYGVKLAAPIVSNAISTVRDVGSAFRPAPAPAVSAIPSGLMLGSGASGGEPGSSSLPIILGAAAAGVLLLLAFGRKKKA